MSTITMAESATPSTPSTGKAKIFVPVSSVPTLAILDDAGVLAKIALSSAATFTYTPLTAWTPGVAFGGGTTGITYTTQVGRYQRIGDIIIATGYCLLSSKGSSAGNATITGFPVAANALSNLNQPIILWIATLTGVSGGEQGFIAPGGSAATLSYTATGTVATMTEANFQNTTSFMVTAVYHV
jgi:hypothetical protein